MNRIGMLVDLSHVSEETMRDALDVSRGAGDLLPPGRRGGGRPPAQRPRRGAGPGEGQPRRGDGQLRHHLPSRRPATAWRAADRSAQQARYNAPPFGGLYIGQPEKAKAALDAWDKEHPGPPATLGQVADHMEHIAKVCGVDCVGIGSDFDGIGDTPVGLDGVDKFPDLLAELARRGWSDTDLAKVAGGNVLRALREAEVAAKKLRPPPSRPTRPSPSWTAPRSPNICPGNIDD